MVSVIISLTAMMYIFQIPAVIMLRKKYPHHPRPFRVPGGAWFLWLCVIGAEAIVIITIITLLWPGLLDNALGQPFSIVDYWGVSRVYFETVDPRHRRVLPAHGGRVLGLGPQEHQEGPRR